MMKKRTKIIIKAKSDEKEIWDNTYVRGDYNVMITVLCSTLNKVCKDNNVDMKKVIKHLRELDKEENE